MSSVSLRFAERKILLLVVDLILVNLTTLFGLWVHAVRNFTTFCLAFIGENLNWFVSLSLLWLLFAAVNGLYAIDKVTNLAKTIQALLGAELLVLLVYLGIFFYSAPLNILPRGIVLYQGVSNFILVGIWRTLYVLAAQHPGFGRRVIIVGAGWAGETIVRAVYHYARHEYRIAGFIDDDESKRDSSVLIELYGNSTQVEMMDTSSGVSINIPVLGTSADLPQLLREEGISDVILAVTHDISTPLFQALLDSKELGVQITLMPVLYEQLTGRVPIEHIGDDNWYVALPLHSAEAGSFYPIVNRMFDIFGALLGLIVLLPFFPFVALAIYLESPGPIFYSQERVGKGGQRFNLLKLRTMIPDAEPGGQAQRALANDSRITRIGRWLRKIRLDEMPQLINILKGEMSAVGPRPERPQHLQELERDIPFHRLRNSVKPGKAGWAVVNYGYIESVEDAKIRLQYDLYYVKHQSLWLDMVILLRTMGQMLTLKGR